MSTQVLVGVILLLDVWPQEHKGAKPNNSPSSVVAWFQTLFCAQDTTEMTLQCLSHQGVISKDHVTGLLNTIETLAHSISESSGCCQQLSNCLHRYHIISTSEMRINYKTTLQLSCFMKHMHLDLPK